MDTKTNLVLNKKQLLTFTIPVLASAILISLAFALYLEQSELYDFGITSYQNTIENQFETRNVLDVFSKIEIPFIENQGQLNPDVVYYAKTFAGTIFVSQDGLTYDFKGASEEDTSNQGVVVKESFLPWQTFQPLGLDKSETIA